MNFIEFKNKYQKVEIEEYPNSVIELIPKPVLSVLVVTYQHKNYIRDAIEGVLMQVTNFPFEIIIGDDDSSDGTREICLEYAAKYPDKIRLFLHKRENNIKILGKPCLIFQYTYNSFNLRGKFVAVVSGDDFWTDPTKLQKQYNFLSNNPDYSMCYHKWVIKNEQSIKSTRLILGKTPRALSLMYINVFKDIPVQFVEVLAEDAFTKFILSTIGKKKYLDDIEPAVYREHDGAIWSLSSIKFKHDNSTLTAQKLLEAYKGTKYKTKLDALFLTRIVLRKLFVIYQNEKNIFKLFINLLKELSYHSITYKFPIKFQISKYSISFHFFFTFVLNALNILRWKFKYFFKI